MQNKSAQLNRLVELIVKYDININEIIPIAIDHNSLSIIYHDNNSHDILNVLKFKLQKKIISKKVSKAEFDLKQKPFIAKCIYAKQHQSISERNIILLVDTIIIDAIDKHTSDIHIEPHKDSLRIRFRLDGLLTIITTLPNSIAKPLISRCKILANLNIAETRLPQDGRFIWNKDQQRDCRMSICPCQHGEKVVIRLLNANQSIITINHIGFHPQQLQHILNSMQKPQGLILVTGPTGSGKTQTLYSILGELNTEHVNISTVEDPIEINLPGITQIQTQNAINLSFATVLRALLRQDPDVIMLGEIRDEETARIAVQAAQTGHLVLATLHTNNAAKAIIRLINMGIPHYQIANCLNCIIAQRLLRQLCQHCRNSNATSQCHHCSNGYSGRIGVFEVLCHSEALEQIILQQSWAQLAEHQASQTGLSLSQHADELITKGFSTQAEATRVLGERL
jgi:type II secretory ATPase GspE/PulE/Tfp pilus assembly ATPase PilB-like protein